MEHFLELWPDFINRDKLPMAEKILMNYVDVCVDGEFMIDLKDTKLLWKGSSNQRVIDVQATLKQEDKLVPVLHCGDYN